MAGMVTPSTLGASFVIFECNMLKTKAQNTKHATYFILTMSEVGEAQSWWLAQVHSLSFMAELGSRDLCLNLATRPHWHFSWLEGIYVIQVTFSSTYSNPLLLIHLHYYTSPLSQFHIIIYPCTYSYTHIYMHIGMMKLNYQVTQLNRPLQTVRLQKSGNGGGGEVSIINWVHKTRTPSWKQPKALFMESDSADLFQQIRVHSCLVQSWACQSPSTNFICYHK